MPAIVVQSSEAAEAGVWEQEQKKSHWLISAHILVSEENFFFQILFYFLFYFLIFFHLFLLVGG